MRRSRCASLHSLFISCIDPLPRSFGYAITSRTVDNRLSRSRRSSSSSTVLIRPIRPVRRPPTLPSVATSAQARATFSAAARTPLVNLSNPRAATSLAGRPTPRLLAPATPSASPSSSHRRTCSVVPRRLLVSLRQAATCSEVAPRHSVSLLRRLLLSARRRRHRLKRPPLAALARRLSLQVSARRPLLNLLAPLLRLPPLAASERVCSTFSPCSFRCRRRAEPPGTTSLFGQPTTTQAPTNNLFGAPPGPTPGLFGAQSTAQSTRAFMSNSTFRSLADNCTAGFGQNAPGTTPFGAAPTTTAPFSGFGQQPSQTQQPTNNLFGGGSSNAFGLNKPTTSLFGQPQAQPQAQNNLFGGFNSGAPKAPTFGGLGQPPAPSFNLGGSTLGAGGLGGGQMGNSFGGFGNSMMGQPQQQQAQLQASIDQNAYGQSPLFNSAPGSTAPAAPFAVVEKAKPPLALPVRGTPRAGSALNRLRGYGTPTSTATAGSSLSWSASPSSATRGSPLSSLPSLGDSSNSVSPHAFIGRSSVKKLVIERKNSDSPGKPVANTPGRLRFDPDAEIAATNGTPSRSATPEVAAAPREEPRTQPSSGAGRSEGSNRRVSSGSRGVPYIFDPPLEELRAMPYEELSKVDRFKVSRAGIGEISWPGPVDLSGIGSLEQIGGGIVKIEARKASVYASDEYLDDKPPEGQGLNKPAKVTLCDIWPINLADRQPIKERGISEDLDARIDEFARKLTQYNVKRPAVESATYDHSEGKWTFRVRHFSGYGLDDDDELIAAGGDMDVDDEDGQSPAPAVKRRSRRQQALPAEEDMQLEEGSGEESDDGTISDGPPTPAADDRETERESSAERDYEEARHAIDSQRDDDESDGASSIVSPPPARGSHLGWLSGKEPGREELMRGSLFSQAKAPRPSMAIASQRFVLVRTSFCLHTETADSLAATFCAIRDQ